MKLFELEELLRKPGAHLNVAFGNVSLHKVYDKPKTIELSLFHKLHDAGVLREESVCPGASTYRLKKKTCDRDMSKRVFSDSHTMKILKENEKLKAENERLNESFFKIMGAVEFAMGQDYPIEFWTEWNEGAFDVVKREWPEFDGYLGDKEQGE